MKNPEELLVHLAHCRSLLHPTPAEQLQPVTQVAQIRGLRDYKVISETPYSVRRQYGLKFRTSVLEYSACFSSRKVASAVKLDSRVGTAMICRFSTVGDIFKSSVANGTWIHWCEEARNARVAKSGFIAV